MAMYVYASDLSVDLWVRVQLSEDARVVSRVDLRDTNFGSEGSFTIFTQTDDNERSFLKANVSTLLSQPLEVYVYVHINTMSQPNSTATDMIFKEVSNDSWSESTITWNNQPAMGDNITSWDWTNADNVTWSTINLTDYVRAEYDGDQIVSFAIRARIEDFDATGRTINLFSKETGAKEPFLYCKVSSTVPYPTFPVIYMISDTPENITRCDSTLSLEKQLSSCIDNRKMEFDGRYVYLGTGSVVKKLEAFSMVEVDSLIIGNKSYPDAINDMRRHETTLYVSTNERVTKIDLATFTKTTETLTYEYIYFLACDSNYVYGSTDYQEVYQLSASSLEQEGYLLGTDYEWIYDIEVSDGFLYLTYADDSDDQYIAKIDESSFSEVGSVFVGSDSYDGELAIDDNYIYVCMSGLSASTTDLYRVSKNTFTLDSSLSLIVDGDKCQNLYLAGDNLYLCDDSAVYVINKSTLALLYSTTGTGTLPKSPTFIAANELPINPNTTGGNPKYTNGAVIAKNASPAPMVSTTLVDTGGMIIGKSQLG